MNSIDHEFIEKEEKIINILLLCDSISSNKIFIDIISEYGDLDTRFVWMISRNLYHVSYSRPHGLICLCNIAKKIFNYLDDNLRFEFQKSLLIPIISFVSDNESESNSIITPYESVYLFGFLCRFGLIDPTPRLLFLFNHYKDLSFLNQKEFINGIRPLLCSCSMMIYNKSPEFFNFVKGVLMNIDEYAAEELLSLLNVSKSEYLPTPCQYIPRIEDFPEISSNARMQMIISNDFIDELRVYWSHPKFEYENSTISSLLTPVESLVDNPSLIAFAAYYGSLHCFRFMIINGCKIERDLESLIVNGGNLDLFHIYDKTMPISNSLLFSSIDYHRDTFTQWYLEHNQIDFNTESYMGMSLMHYACETNNISFLKFLLSKGVGFVFDNEYDSSPFELACQYDCVSIVSLISNQLPQEEIIKGFIAALNGNANAVCMHLISIFPYIKDNEMVKRLKNESSDSSLTHALNQLL